jgi:hypothetical protein
VHTQYYSANLKEREHLRDPVIDGRTITEMCLEELECEDVEWVHPAQDRVQWRVL